ncbi:Early nodulin-93 [Nymphaea thermarum]|nr:Early nodulin-93 [Nymphaea thermarum]
MASETSAMSSTQNVVSSPLEMNGLSPFDHKISMAKRYAHEGVVAGAKAAVVASIATAIPTFACVRTLQWAKYNLNPTAQALVISTDNIKGEIDLLGVIAVAGAAYFIVADKTVLASARKNSFKDIQA